MHSVAVITIASGKKPDARRAVVKRTRYHRGRLIIAREAVTLRYEMRRFEDLAQLFMVLGLGKRAFPR